MGPDCLDPLKRWDSVGLVLSEASFEASVAPLGHVKDVIRVEITPCSIGDQKCQKNP